MMDGTLPRTGPPQRFVPPFFQAAPRRLVTATDLKDLVTHNEWVPADLSMEDMVKQFNQTKVSYVAVQENERVVGVVSRESIGLLFGGRYGFSLFASEPVTSRMEPHFLAFRRSTPILEVLNSSLNREGPE